MIPPVSGDALTARAEELWEALGGDLCICQRPDVPHWCENCQRLIGLIRDALLAAGRSAATTEPRMNEQGDHVCEHGTAMDVHCCNCHSGFIFDYQHECPEPQTMADAAEMLWVVLANVSGGNWTLQSKDWQEAAARWRDNYFAVLKAQSAPAPLPLGNETP